MELGRCCDNDSGVDASTGQQQQQQQQQQVRPVREDSQQPQPQEPSQAQIQEQIQIGPSPSIIDHGSVINVSTVTVVPSESCQVSSHCIPIDDGHACVQVTKSNNDTTTGTSSRCCYNVDSPAPIPMGTPESDWIHMTRKLVTECVGTSLLVMIVVGSGIAGETLSEDNVGIQLLINSVATMGGLYSLISILGPVSGAHFNPIVSMVDRMYGDMPTGEMGWYVIVQCLGGIVGSVIANIMYDIPTTISDKSRFGYNLWISEIIATATLIMVIHGCIRTGNESSVPYAVSAWVGAGYFFTSSSIFANPAVTIGRIFTNTFAGIDPRSAVIYICFQLIGGVCGYGVVRFLYPTIPSSATPIARDDPLYRRVYVLVNQEFFANNNTYTTQPTKTMAVPNNNNNNDIMPGPSSVASIGATTTL